MAIPQDLPFINLLSIQGAFPGVVLGTGRPTRPLSWSFPAVGETENKQLDGHNKQDHFEWCSGRWRG